MTEFSELLQARILGQLRRPAVQLGVFFVAWSILFFAINPSSSTATGGDLVVYCAHEANISKKILKDFTAKTGIPVDVRFASESTKSLSLTDLLIREKGAPRCDVLWNDEALGTLDLQQRGLLQPYKGPGHAHISAAFKARDGSWTGFAARLRVTISNTAKIGTTPPNLDALLPGSDYSKIAIAKPLSGTTLAHYAALWKLWGRDRLIAWHRDWRTGGVRECDSDGAVMAAVGEGTCFAGYTDTDDFFAARDAGQPVAMSPVRLEDGKTLAIPNTVSIIRGTRRLDAAQKLVDYLLSAETEIALAGSKSRQIPLGDVRPDQMPEEVRELADWARESTDLTALGSARAECLAWLKSEYQP